MVLEGANGIGKTSLLEALYYACYLRSFRTRTTKELISFGQNAFFMKLDVQDDSLSAHTISIGFSPQKRLVKVDQQVASSYKDLMLYYKVLSVTEQDLLIVQGGPQERRTVLDQFLLLANPDYAYTMRAYRQLVDQRNALIAAPMVDKETYAIVTKQLWQRSHEVQQVRMDFLVTLQQEVGTLQSSYLPHMPLIELLYMPKRELGGSIDDFNQANPDLYAQERRYRRTLFGSHLDDVGITFSGRPARLFASRGQQKLIVLLIKMAQLRLLSAHGHSGIFLLDDFMTDFDPDRASLLLDALSGLESQLIFTSPIAGGDLAKKIISLGGKASNLTY